MSTSTEPNPRCACGAHTAHPGRPTNVKRLLTSVCGLFQSSKNVFDGAKGVLALGKTFILPAIGFTASGVTKASLAARIQAKMYQARTRGIFSVLQSLGARASPPPSPIRLLASALFLPYGAWKLYKLLASDGDPNSELWQRRVECSCEHGERDERAFLASSTFVDCCFAAALLCAGIASVQPLVIVAALWEVPQIVKSFKENFWY